MASAKIGRNVFIIGLLSWLISGCETTSSTSSPRVERLLAGSGQATEAPRPFVKRRAPWEALTGLSNVYNCGGKDHSEKFSMSQDAIRKAVVQSSLFKSEDIDRAVLAFEDWIESEEVVLCGSYQGLGGDFRAYFHQKPGKEVTLVIQRDFYGGAGPFAIMSILEGVSSYERYYFNLDGELLDVKRGSCGFTSGCS